MLTKLSEFCPFAEPKRQRILEGAMKVFLAYGFQRTTMDDIARAAEMSRPAVYLQFKNKAEIYRAISAMLLDRSVRDAATTLETAEALPERLTTMIDVCMIRLMRMVAQSPHGADLLDANNALACDLTKVWRCRMSALLQQAFADEARRRGVDLAERGLCAKSLAGLMLDGLEGMKKRLMSPDDHSNGVRSLVRVFDLALRPDGLPHQSS